MRVCACVCESVPASGARVGCAHVDVREQRERERAKGGREGEEKVRGVREREREKQRWSGGGMERQ